MPRRYRYTRSTRSLRDELLRDLEREGEKLLKQMTEQFLRDLERQAGQALPSALGGNAAGGGLGNFDVTGGLTRIFGSVLTFIFSRPRTRTSSRESERSKQAEADFRLSRRQALAEAGIELNKGGKNL